MWMSVPVEHPYQLSPLYQQVYQKLCGRISAGVYARGTMLPSEGQLRREFGVSLITFRRAAVACGAVPPHGFVWGHEDHEASR